MAHLANGNSVVLLWEAHNTHSVIEDRRSGESYKCNVVAVPRHCLIKLLYVHLWNLEILLRFFLFISIMVSCQLLSKQNVKNILVWLYGISNVALIRLSGGGGCLTGMDYTEMLGLKGVRKTAITYFKGSAFLSFVVTRCFWYTYFLKGTLKGTFLVKGWGVGTTAEYPSTKLCWVSPFLPPV